METQKLRWILVIIAFAFWCDQRKCDAIRDCEINKSDRNQVFYTITVGGVGTNANFSSIQAAIDFIPTQNNRWIRIILFNNIYREKVNIPPDKSCIYIVGQDPNQTIITWGSHENTLESTTFSVSSDNIILKNLTIKNSYILETDTNQKLKQAVAVKLEGDKIAVYKCNFVALQDTLWDDVRRHYFVESNISGLIDFIWGSGQSIYENCTITVNVKMVDDHNRGVITAQGRDSESDPSGFVFKWCNVIVLENGSTLLGRSYRSYSRVIFYQNQFFGQIIPRGWDAWDSQGNEEHTTYVEVDNKGEGANTTNRVSWLKKLSQEELNNFISLSFISPQEDDWISKLPYGSLQ